MWSFIWRRGATLWQSPRKEHYTYDVHYGHDIAISGINWTHAGLTLNYPLVYIGDAKNVKLTGFGTIRDDDTASENDDSTGGTIWVGCEKRIHLIPLAVYHSENVEISDISIRRSNCYHLFTSFSKNMAIRNVSMLEATCASGDGIGNAGNKNVLIDRNILYSNDDAITLWAQYNDPRGLLWWHAHPGEDESVANIRIVHNNLFGGHGVTFIPWGTDTPNLSNQEIRDITIMDNVLTGNSASIGAWPDNPYYGRDFDNAETNDFSPVKNVRIFGNRCYNITDLLCIRATNLLSDCGIYSTDQFENGDFERKNGKSGWVSGLSNWSIEDASGGSTAQAIANGSGHAGSLTGKQFFFQGVRREAGNHRLSMAVNVTAGKAELVAVNGETNRVLATTTISGSGTKTLDFSLAKPTMVKLGIRLLEDSSAVTVDNASVSKIGAYAYPDAFYEDFESDTYMHMPIGAWTVREEDGNYVLKKTDSLPSYTELISVNQYTDFDMQMDFMITDVLSSVDANVGITFFRTNDDNSSFFEYNPVGQYVQIRSFIGGAQVQRAFKNNVSLTTNEWHTMGLRVTDDAVYAYIDGELVMQVPLWGGDNRGFLHINTYNVQGYVDNVIVAPQGTMNFSKATEPETVTTVTDDKYYISLKNTGEGRKNVIIVSYDAQGRVEKVSLVHTDGASVIQDKHIKNANVFVWDGIKPLTPREEIW